MTCQDCQLHKTRTRIVMPTPCRPGGVLAIGEAPGAEEDLAGEGFVGRAGKTLDRLMAECGVARDGYGRANICRCRPVEDGKNRKPKQPEIDACLPKLAESIGQMDPKVILCVGWTPGKLFFEQPTLFDAIKAGGRRLFHPGAEGLPAPLRYIRNPVYVVAMPHTSPLAFNRNAQDGRKWADIAVQQVALAASLAGLR